MKEVVPTLDSKAFLKDIYDGEWDQRELKQRMHHITGVLKNYLSEDYATNVDTLLKLIPFCIKGGFKPDNLEFFFLPDFVESFGLQYYVLSMRAIENITQFVSCEFAVRP
ncbi:MAG: DNA alkylation repair protein, partial [Bacteroidota bacterium]